MSPLTFVGDVPKNTIVYLPGSEEGVSVEELAERRQFRRVTIRPQAKGFLEVEAMSVAVEVEVNEEGEEEKYAQWRLIVTRDLGSGDIKYSLSNSEDPMRRLAYMQRQRYWIERNIQDAKTSCGMAQYQVRGWKAWHHHMALVMLAMLFLFQERVIHSEELPLLSCQDIVNILDHGLIQSQQNQEMKLDAMRTRHRQTQAEISRHPGKAVKIRSGALHLNIPPLTK